MPVCGSKEAVEQVLSKAQAALATAEGEKAKALRRLVMECKLTLAKAEPWPGYPGGRLEASFANEALEAADQVCNRFPDLDLDPLAE